jgi:hypothetical protein
LTITPIITLSALLSGPSFNVPVQESVSNIDLCAIAVLAPYTRTNVAAIAIMNERIETCPPLMDRLKRAVLTDLDGKIMS